jgi:hypothetical protein
MVLPEPFGAVLVVFTGEELENVLQTLATLD